MKKYGEVILLIILVTFYAWMCKEEEKDDR